MPKKSVKNTPVEEPIIESEFFDEPEPAIEEQEETFTFKRSHFYAAITVFAFAAGVLLGYVVWGMNPAVSVVSDSNTSAQAESPVVEAPVTETPQFIRYDVPSDGFPSLGPEDAPITLIEFSDYQCPYCRRWHEEVYQPLLNAYPGQIRFVYRNLPLSSIHPDAQSAAESAMCAGEQSAYWQYHEKLFSDTSLGTNTYMQYAQELGLDTKRFETCITENKYRDFILADNNFALDLGVRSTPTFFINGLAVVGAQPLDIFKQVIDKELAGEIPK